jgi:hypothetical protein
MEQRISMALKIALVASGMNVTEAVIKGKSHSSEVIKYSCATWSC